MNNLNDNIKLGDSEGYIRISRTQLGGAFPITGVIYEGPNAFTATAPQILATLLGGTSANALDNLSVVQGAVILANGTSFTVSYPAANQVKFVAQFSAASFNGTFDELRLTSAAGSDFSTKTGLSITKTSSQSMQVEWTLTINL